MTTLTPELAALRSVRLTWAPNYEAIWGQDHSLHVAGLHEEAWDELVLALEDAVASDGPCPLGLVITGPKGSGKTHLLGEFRAYVQQQGHYFVLLELLDAADFWQTTLTSLRDSLGRPDPQRGTQLRRLLWQLSDDAGLSRHERRAVIGEAALTPAILDRLTAKLPSPLRQHHGVLRALALLASSDSRQGDVGATFLYNVDAEDTVADRRHWGLPPTGRPALDTVRAISALMARTGATVVAVDQIDTLLAQSYSSLGGTTEADSPAIDQIAHGLMALREALRRTVTIACMLPVAWHAIRTRATGSVPDRFRETPALKGLPDGRLAEAIVARRLGAAYEEKRFKPAYPTWPIRREAFDGAVHSMPRQVLKHVDSHIQECVRTRTVTELPSFGDSGTASAGSSPAQAGPPTEIESSAQIEETATVDAAKRSPIDDRFDSYRASARIESAATDQSTADRRMPALLQAGLRAWTREQGGDFEIEVGRGRGPLDVRLRESLSEETDDEQHWAFRAIPATNSIAVIARVRGAANAALTAGVDRRRLFVLRSTPWPSGAKTAEVVREALDRGATVLPLEPEDLAVLSALDALIKDAPDGLDDWLVSRRPAHGLTLFRELPGSNAQPALGGGTPETEPGTPATMPEQPRGSTRAAAPDLAEQPSLWSEPERSLEDTAPATNTATSSSRTAGTAATRPTQPAASSPATGRVDPHPTGTTAPPATGRADPPATGRADSSANGAAAPPAIRAADPILIGFGPGGAPVSIDPAELRKHTAVFAGSGSGKTVLLRRLIEECALRGVSSIVLDPNNDLSRLGDPWPEHPSGWWPTDEVRAREYLDTVDVVVWTPNKASGRPLVFQPLPDFAAVRDDHEQFEQAVDMAVGTLERYAGLAGSGGKREQQRAVIREALRAYGRITDDPSLAGYIEYLGAWPATGLSAIKSVDKLAPGLADTLAAAMINNPLLGGDGQPVSPDLLLTPAEGKRARVSVISLIGLPDGEPRQSFISQLQLALFTWIKKHPAGDRPLGWLLVMDEAQQIAPSGQVTPATASTLLLASQARKYGLGLVYATQAPKGLNDKIPGNAATHVFGKLGVPVQIQAAKEMAQARNGNVDGIGRLEPGSFYLGTGAGTPRITTPMCLSFHPASPPTEDEVIERARQLAGAPL